MFWFKNFMFLFLVAGLASCGFHPLYSTTQKQSDIGIKIISSENTLSKIVASQLKQIFSSSSKPKYILKFTIDLTSKEASVKPSGEVARKFLTGKINFTLSESATKKTLLSDSISASTAFRQDDNYHLSNLAAAQSAKQNIIKKLVKLLGVRITIFVDEKNENKTL